MWIWWKNQFWIRLCSINIIHKINVLKFQFKSIFRGKQVLDDTDDLIINDLKTFLTFGVIQFPRLIF